MNADPIVQLESADALSVRPGGRLYTGHKPLRVIEADFERDPRWNAFVTAHPQGLIYHHGLWLGALKSEFGQQALALACVDGNDKFQGILPLVYTRGLPLGITRIHAHATGPRLTSLPRTPESGPLTNGPEAFAVLLREAIQRVNLRPGAILELKLRSTDADGLVPALPALPWRVTYVLELPDASAPLRFGNSKQNHKINWAVNRGRALGIAVREAEREETLRDWYKLYLETMRRVVAPARPYRFFLHLWRELRPRGLMRLLLAVRSVAGEDEMLAGSIFLMCGQSVHYAFTGCRSSSLPLHVNDVLQWEAITQAHRERFRFYDFGEVPGQRLGLAEFKSKWCARPQPLYRYYYPCKPVESSADGEGPTGPQFMRSVWRHLPLGWTESLSGRIFSYL